MSWWNHQYSVFLAFCSLQHTQVWKHTAPCPYFNVNSPGFSLPFCCPCALSCCFEVKSNRKILRIPRTRNLNCCFELKCHRKFLRIPRTRKVRMLTFYRTWALEITGSWTELWPINWNTLVVFSVTMVQKEKMDRGARVSQCRVGHRLLKTLWTWRVHEAEGLATSRESLEWAMMKVAFHKGSATWWGWSLLSVRKSNKLRDIIK